MTPARRFLFLQGPPSLFWARLGDALRARGHHVARVNFHLGDRLFWPRPGAYWYRGRFAGWRGWLDALLAREATTDIVYYADRLPYHAVALEVARARGIRVHAVEFGYLRPDWITLEPDGMGRVSTFPREPAAIRRLAEGRPDPDMVPRHAHTFVEETVNEVAYTLLMVFGRPVHPFYRSDRYYWPLAEYVAWLARIAARRVTGPVHERFADRCIAREFPYTLVALQLQMDYQIRASSRFRHLEDMLDEVMASMALHAPADRHLVVKTHPLDNGLELWPLRLRRLARRHGLRGRVHLVDSPRLAPLIRASEGVILVNSTVGLHALGDGVPVIALGHAIYDMPGLTHQAGLAAFWRTPERPDMSLVRDLRRALAAHVQVRGSFYSREGARVAIAALADRLSEGAPVPWLPQRRSPTL